MKCPLCNGRKKILEPCDGALLGTVLVTCYACNGTGEVTMTNEKWLEQANTEEKAKFLKEISFCCNTCSPEQFEAYKNGKFKCPLKMACATANGFEDWLKEKHNEMPKMRWKRRIYAPMWRLQTM